MAMLIYTLCALASFGIAGLLWRHYVETRSRLLYWSAWCFTGLTLNNVLLVADKLMLPQYDLSLPRLIAALCSLSVLLFGLIYEDE